MNGYLKDLRVRVLGAVDRGTPRRETTGLFGVSLSTLKRWLRRRRDGEDLAPRPSPGRTPRILLATTEEKRALWEQLEANDEMPRWSATASCGRSATAREYRQRR